MNMQRDYRRVWERIAQAMAEGRVERPVKLWWRTTDHHCELDQVVDGEPRVRLSAELQRRFRETDWAAIDARVNKRRPPERVEYRRGQRDEIAGNLNGAFSPNTLAIVAIGPVVSPDRETHDYNAHHFTLDADVLRKVFPELARPTTPVAVEYFSKNLRFVRKHIEPLQSHERFRIRTPQGNFVMTKAEFESVFANVATNEENYLKDGAYNYSWQNLPSKAKPFLEKLDGAPIPARMRLKDLHDEIRRIEGDGEEEWEDENDEGDDEDDADQRFRARNVILFGPPGTGKSHRLQAVYLPGIGIDPAAAAGRLFRVTFHPEYSYFDFVGSYKPLVGLEPAERGSVGIDGKTLALRDGTPARPIIYYGFEPGPFTEALIAALSNPDRNVALIIEEINRGNCAAIFGDIFQLLDRNAAHGSQYTIRTPAPMAAYLQSQLAREVPHLSLPSNLFLYATMNTSDQALFPMDTAFKRRWSLEYVGISFDDPHVARVEVPITDRTYCAWATFARLVNRKVVDTTGVDDKQMGPYFVQPEAGLRVSAAAFRSKVLFYLWSDALRGHAGVVFDPALTTYDALVRRHEAGQPVFTRELLEALGGPSRGAEVPAGA
jgi:hypothetical protein